MKEEALSIWENIGTFRGKKVVNFEEAPLDLQNNAYRIGVDWDECDEGITIIHKLEKLLAAAGGELKELIIGPWGQECDDSSEEIVAASSRRLPLLWPRCRQYHSRGS